MEKLLVSIVTPCFNSEKTIKRTIESVLNQTYDNIEYIIIDGGSTDNTLNIIKEYNNNLNGKIRVISEKDNGIYDAMNKGISLCNGELIGIINSDDWYENDAIEKICSNFNGEKYNVLYGMVKVWENNIIRNIYFRSHQFIEKRMIAHPTCFVTKNIYEDFGMFNLEYKSSADYELILRFSLNKEIKFTPVYDIIANFTAGGMSGGQTGVRETAKIKWKHKLIGKTRLYYIYFKSYLYEKLH